VGSVLVGVDFTTEGEAALDAGIEEAARRQALLVLVHHVRLAPEEQHVMERREQGERLLARAGEQAAAAGVEFRTELELGPASAGSVLLDKADELDADVIVVGTRRRSRVGKALMGSDAQQVILNAACQVLCVKAGPAPVEALDLAE
jgi:nucleotide-binding universal stress UspA family protein